jgi:protein TonB
MSAAPPLPVHSTPRVSRNAAIAGAVVVLHGAAIWGLNSGLLRRAVEVVVPIELLSQVITPPAPKIEPRPVPPPPAPARPPVPKQVTPPQPRTPPPAPRPVAAPSPAAAPNAPTAVAEPQPAPPPISAPVALAPAPAPAPAAPPAPPAPPRIELPSTTAGYLQNPKPPYPPMSKRLGEQGRVTLRVLIGADGSAKDAQVQRSSGYERLDKIALDTVRSQWRFVPGKRNGVPEDMWFEVPVNFVLD